MASEDPNDQPIQPFYESAPVTVIVGTHHKQRTFYVNEELLKRHSEYFQGALSGDFIEGQTKSVRLEEDDSSAFDLFARYSFAPDSCVAWKEELLSLVEAYMLGDKLLASGFKDHIAWQLYCRLEARLLPMAEILSLARSIYYLTSRSNGATIRDVLAWYTADNMRERKVCTWAPPAGPTWNWTYEERDLFLSSELDRFRVDAMIMMCHPSKRPSAIMRSSGGWFN